MWTFLYYKLCNHQTFGSLRPTRGLNLWRILCLNFWYIYHMGLQQLSPCTTTSFNGSWRTGSISSTILLPRVSRKITTESSEWAYIPTSPRSQLSSHHAPPDYSRIPRRQCVSLEIKEPFYIWIANKMTPHISLFFHSDGQLNGSPRSYHILWLIEYL
jgi:hypothetical protein